MIPHSMAMSFEIPTAAASTEALRSPCSFFRADISRIRIWFGLRPSLISWAAHDMPIVAPRVISSGRSGRVAGRTFSYTIRFSVRQILSPGSAVTLVYENVRLSQDGQKLDVHICPRESSCPTCCGCGRKGPVYDHLPKARRFEFGPLWQAER